MKNDPLKTLKIDAEIYDRLRAYCDQNSIRFADFTEEMLENAIGENEAVRALDEARLLTEQMDAEREKAYARGFQEGFCLAFSAALGRMGTPDQQAGLRRALRNRPARKITGPQLELF
ncbi:hypothetical protein [Desulfonema ishimotonii]|nr:hypothetical protein [Desulfonema ishimotonii]